MWLCLANVLCIILMLHTIAVSGQECTNTVGSLSHNNSNLVTQGQTFILTGYIIPCSGTVVAWEFCYRASNATSVTFYPGIWRISGTLDNKTNYSLVKSYKITYDPRKTSDICDWASEKGPSWHKIHDITK